MSKGNSKGIKRVFISSTYEDMKEYRDAAEDALTSIEQFPIGMSNFVPSTESPLEVCLSNVRRCEMLIIILGMRYGSIDEDTGKSYTELEYEEALRNKIPVLTFMIDEQKCPILPVFVDTGEKAEKLAGFKKTLRETRYCASFSSKEDLKNIIIRSVGAFFKDNTVTESQKPSMSELQTEGLYLYRKFVLIPERLKDSEVVLRVRMDGIFANSFIRRQELYDAYGLRKGDTVVAENVIPIGLEKDDIDDAAAYMDLYAEGSNADWIIENGITTGVVFDGKFRLAYEIVKGVAQNKASRVPFDSPIPALILLEGIAVVGKSKSEKFSKREAANNLISTMDQFVELLESDT